MTTVVDHYCTLDNVNDLCPQAPFTETSKPKATTVESFIEHVAKRMDATLAELGYTTPVTEGVESLALLREACAWGTLGLAQQVRDTGVKTAVTESGRPIKNIWTQQYDDWLKRLEDPQIKFKLPDAPITDEAIEKDPDQIARSFDTDDPDGDPDFDPVVSKAQVF